MKFDKPIELLQKYLSGEISPEEKEIVERWYAALDGKQGPGSTSPKDLATIKKTIYQHLVDELGIAAPVVPIYKKLSFRAAAAVLIILIGSSYLFFTRNEVKPVVATSNQKYKNDVVPPATNKATLTLADGSVIALDSTGKGTLAVQGKVDVIKRNDGLIEYAAKGATDVITYNTLSVPRGSKPMKLLLADGSEVWLNVASSITYPTAFTEHERKVEITGEVYFEIAHATSPKNGQRIPFIVKKKNEDAQVEVLGTHFNVNAYDDESDLKVTLLEGSVNVSKAGNHGLLKPGQQAVMSDKQISVLDHVDLEKVMAWKNGRFYFDGADIKTVMKQVEKWYDVDVKYETEIPYSFVAKISRNVNASELLNILQLTELVHFKIEGNKITVMK